MTKRAVHSLRPPASILALCLVLLQLVTALHFSLVPHGFGAGSGGLVHLHRARSAEPRRTVEDAATQRAPVRPTLVAGSAACAPDECSLGFSGHTFRTPSPSRLSSLIWLPKAGQLSARADIVRGRNRALLSAPKTSPPLAV